MNVLIVCTGNTCRSSMAEAMLQKLIDDSALKDDIKVSSAGLAAIPNMMATEQAIEVMSERGIDLLKHRSRIVNNELLAVDLVLTMTKRHRDYIIQHYPAVSEKVFTLKEYAEVAELDVLDPYGGDKEVYRNTADEIAKVLERVLERIKKELKN